VTSTIEPFLRALVDCGGSDLHCKVGSPPRVRIDGKLRKLQTRDLTSATRSRWSARSCARTSSRSSHSTNEADFATRCPGVGRFRVNAFRSRGSCGPGLPPRQRRRDPR
jgi:twitching motility protein PilT